MDNKQIRLDHRLIMKMIDPNSTVLDLGCGNGDLMQLLAQMHNCRVQGIEISENEIYACVAKGLNVLHGDIDSGLAEYADKSFDYVILNQSLQQLKHFDTVFKESLRVGRRAIVGLPNFAHYKARLQFFFLGRAPVTASLPYSWYDSPNAHFLSVTDFLSYCKIRGAKVERSLYVGEKRKVKILPNLFADLGIYLLTKEE